MRKHARGDGKMFAGHFGLAAAVKAKTPEVPLWALVVSTQLLDVVFVPLFLAGVETMEPVGAGGYGESIIHADYSHSLLGALLISLLAGWIGGRLWGRRGGLVIAALAFSHWLLDLAVHRTDMPILPGNTGDLPLLGFGLWTSASASIAVEAILLAVGFFLYTRSIVGAKGVKSNRGIRFAAIGTMGGLLVLSLLADVLGIG